MVTPPIHRLVKARLLEAASDYVMWVSGHGGDTPTLLSYLTSLDRFPDVWDAWAASLSIPDLVATIPHIRHLSCLWPNPVGEGVAHDMPSEVQLCVALSIQHRLMGHVRPPFPGQQQMPTSYQIGMQQQYNNAKALASILYNQLMLPR